MYPQLETLLTYPSLPIAPFVSGHDVAPQEFRMICYDNQAMTSINGLKSLSPLMDIEPIFNNDVVCTGLPYEFVN
jgi:hypothetical protein